LPSTSKTGFPANTVNPLHDKAVVDDDKTGRHGNQPDDAQTIQNGQLVFSACAAFECQQRL
jgi:hypothetical protein